MIRSQKFIREVGADKPSPAPVTSTLKQMLLARRNARLWLRCLPDSDQLVPTFLKEVTVSTWEPKSTNRLDYCTKLVST
jgi:hypothetical protein